MDFKTLYNDPKFSGSFTGQERFISALKNAGISSRGARRALQKIDSYTLHKPVKKPLLYRRVYTKRIGYLYQIDLVDMTKFSKENRGYKWFITCLDTFSKKAWAFKIKDKRGKTITNAMRGFLTQNPPEKIEFDQGKEFLNSLFLRLLRGLNIHYYNTYSDRKCSLVERFNRTLKTRMYRSFTARGSYKWITVIQDLVDGYNDSKHRSIGMAPNKVNAQNEAEVRERLFPRVGRRRQKIRFQPGQTVRITRKKGIFEKGYEMTYSYEVFIVESVKPTYPVTYALQDFNGQVLKGSFYDREIQLVDKSDDIYPIEKIIRTRNRRGAREYLVKWVGYPAAANSWVSHQDLFTV